MFDRIAAYGKRLNIAAGTAVRFEPGELKSVSLVDIAGERVIRGGNSIASGKVDKSPENLKKIQKTLESEGFVTRNSDEAQSKRQKKHLGSEGTEEVQEGPKISRDLYARMYGPTTGDMVQLADTSLQIRVRA